MGGPTLAESKKRTNKFCENIANYKNTLNDAHNFGLAMETYGDIMLKNRAALEKANGGAPIPVEVGQTPPKSGFQYDATSTWSKELQRAFYNIEARKNGFPISPDSVD